MNTTSIPGIRPAPVADVPVTMQYCLYARKSSEAEEKQALSIDSQIKEMCTTAQKNGLVVAHIYRESHSAKDCGQRPVFNQLLEDIRSGKYNGILVWHPDRLSRNAGDLGALVDLLDQKKLVEIRTYSQKFTNNPNEKFLLMILGSQAKLENDNKSINVKRGLRTRAEMGLLPGYAPIGYLNDKRSDHKCEYLIDPLRAPIIKMIFEKVAKERWSGPKIYAWLNNEMKFTTRTGAKLSISIIYNIFKNPFYCGVYEYPRGSGNWYVGKHEPLVSQELFQEVGKKIIEDTKQKKQKRDFTFVRMMVCGHCNSGITAFEKEKIKSDGTTCLYTYYGCCRGKDRNCKNPYVREESVIAQLSEIIDTIEIDEIGARRLIDKEISRYNKLRSTVIGSQGKDSAMEMDIRKYARYLLEEGSMDEKRELLEHLRGKLVIDNKKIILTHSI